MHWLVVHLLWASSYVSFAFLNSIIVFFNNFDIDQKIRDNFVCLQKWHPDKHLGDSAVTAKFQDINEAYKGNSHACTQARVLYLVQCIFFLVHQLGKFSLSLWPNYFVCSFQKLMNCFIRIFLQNAYNIQVKFRWINASY